MRKNNKNLKIALFIMFLSMMALGYAILQANLQINGTTKISSNTWDVHFANIQINQDSVALEEGDSAATIDSNDTCKVDFSVTLSLPGDFYEFSVDVVNAGSIDAMIGAITKTLKVDNVVVDQVPDYLNYTVTNEDDTEIENNHLLEKNTTETYKIRLEFRSDIEELPTGSKTISLSIETQFVQADSTAIESYGLFTLGKKLESEYNEELYREKEIDNELITYSTSEEAQEAWRNTKYQSYPFYFRIKTEPIIRWKILEDGNDLMDHYFSEENCLDDLSYYSSSTSHVYTCEPYKSIYNIIKRLFIEFVITENMANNNTGMTPGTYTLELGIDEHSNQETPVYDKNKEKLKKAMGTNNCSIYNDSISCQVNGLVISTAPSGSLYIGNEPGHNAIAYCKNSNENYYCDV